MADATVQLQMEPIANSNVEEQDGTEDTELLRAIRSGEDEKVEALLER